MLSIDCQSHVFPPEYAELLTQNEGRLQATGGDGIYTIDYWGIQRFRLELEAYSVERKLDAMNAAGVDVSVLSVTFPVLNCWIPNWPLRAHSSVTII